MTGVKTCALPICLFSFLGADTIYRNLEGKLASYTDLTGNKKQNPTTNVDDSENSSSTTSNETDTIDEVIGEITYE